MNMNILNKILSKLLKSKKVDQSKTVNIMGTKTQETNKKIASQSFVAVSKCDFDLLEKISDTKKFKLHFPGYSAPLDYKESEKLAESFNSAFPDTKVIIENQIAEGDYVLSRLIYEGTHKGEFKGLAPTYKKVKTSGMSLQHIVNGKIVEEWDQMDSLGMLQQIDAIPKVEKLVMEERD